MTALVVPPDGPTREIEWPAEGEQLATLYREIGCTTVTVVPTGYDDVTVWADDEGLFVAEPEINPAASMMCGQPIVGTVVVTGPAGPDGETLPLPEGLIGFQSDEG